MQISWYLCLVPFLTVLLLVIAIVVLSSESDDKLVSLTRCFKVVK